MEQRDAASSAAEKWLGPYDKRDATVDEGLVPVDMIDPDTGQHRTVIKQIHQPRKVVPFNFGLAEARSLARYIRQELNLR